ncbi:MAG: FAD:protein FMN transferase [Oscillospiraceae bacterium]
MKKIFTEKRLVLFTALLAAATLGILLFTWLAKTPVEEVTTYSMGSYVQQTVYGGSAKDAAAEAANEIASLDDLISWRKIGGNIQQLNANAGGAWQKLDPKAFSVLQSALSVAEKSGGAFDPTIAPLSRLWNFDDNPTTPPKDEDILKFKTMVDYTKIKTAEDTGSACIAKKGYAIDLGGVGKGAACDTAAQIYEKRKVQGGIVAVGGSVGIYGEKPNRAPWNVAVRDPKSDGALGSLSLTNGFISTSGSYEKCFTDKGKRYHHILDPKTGYPAESGLISVTVVCDNGAVSDALATACFVLGLEKSLPLLKEFAAEAIFIDEKNLITVTEGLQSRFTLSSEEYQLHE